MTLKRPLVQRSSSACDDRENIVKTVDLAPPEPTKALRVVTKSYPES